MRHVSVWKVQGEMDEEMKSAEKMVPQLEVCPRQSVTLDMAMPERPGEVKGQEKQWNTTFIHELRPWKEKHPYYFKEYPRNPLFLPAPEPQRIIPDRKLSCGGLGHSGILSPAFSTSHPSFGPDPGYFLVISSLFSQWVSLELTGTAPLSLWPEVTICLKTGEDRPPSFGCPHSATGFTCPLDLWDARGTWESPPHLPSSVDVVLPHAVCLCGCLWAFK